jgi:hypothetical protein
MTDADDDETLHRLYGKHGLHTPTSDWKDLLPGSPELGWVELYRPAIIDFAGRLYAAGIHTKRITMEFDGAREQDVSLITPVGTITLCKPRTAPPKAWLETYNAALSGGQGCVPAEIAANRVHGEWKKP